jgi:hypothetical protein
MRKTILFLFLGVCLLLFVSDLHAMECQIVDGEGNVIYSADAGELVYFKSTYAYSKPKKLAWNLMVTLPSVDLKNYKTSMKHNGYFFHEGSLENKSRLIPIVIPKDNFIEGTATFKYTLTGNGNCYVYLNISQESESPSASTLTATAVTSSRIDLSWTACTDNIAVVGYKIYDSYGSNLRSVNGTSTYFDGLNPGTQYCYRVTAYDAAGNESAFSNTACATTFPTQSTLTGHWTGTWDSTNHYESGSLNVYMNQTGESLTGTVYISGSPCFLSANLNGQVKENNFSFGAVSNQDSTSFFCTHNNFQSMQCNYLVDSGQCAGDYGTANLNKE